MVLPPILKSMARLSVKLQSDISTMLFREDKKQNEKMNEKKSF